MQVRFDDVLDAKAVLVCLVEVEVNVTLRIDHCGYTLRADHVRCVRQATEVEMLEVHGPSSKKLLNPLPPDYREYSCSGRFGRGREAGKLADHAETRIGRVPNLLPRAGAEAGKNVAALFGEIIPPGVADEARARSPAAAAQNLTLAAEPGLGIFFVRIDSETRVGQKISRSPLPAITKHLPVSEDR